MWTWISEVLALNLEGRLYRQKQYDLPHLHQCLYIKTTSIFDLVSDEQLYNQDLSSILMGFNPIYSNILPYGDATPNRS